MEELKVSARETIYIGDNPYKDFVSAKKFGIHTIRIMRGQYKNLKVRKEYEADYQIKSLDKIFNIIKNLK